jgi:hypothetical protein
LTVVREAASDPRNVSVVGICSGSWYAAHAARALGLSSAILINPGIWNWRSVSRLAWQWNVHRDLRWAAQRSTAEPTPSSQDSRRPSLRKRVVEQLKPHRDRLKAALRANVPYSAMRMLGRTGMSQAPEAVLEELTREGTSTTVILSPTDARLFDEVGGYRAADDLIGANLPLRVHHISSGDHAAYHQSVLVAIREQVLLQVDDGSSAVDHAVAHTTSRRDLNGDAHGDAAPLAQPAPTPYDGPNMTAWSPRANPRLDDPR